MHDIQRDKIIMEMYDDIKQLKRELMPDPTLNQFSKERGVSISSLRRLKDKYPEMFYRLGKIIYVKREEFNRLKNGNS